MHLTMEALLSLILLVFLITVPMQGKDSGEKLGDLYIIQKEHDLMKVWFLEGNFSTDVLVRDFEFVFPGKSGFVEVNGGKVFVGRLSSEKVVSSNGVFFVDGKRFDVSISVVK